MVEVYNAELDGAGEPVTGEDGHYRRAELAFYTAMGTGEGWGDEIPEILRNGDWNYAVFAPDKTKKDGINQAKCFACHKPLAEDDYLFSLGSLQDVLE